jgi:hypothetical protein
VTKARLRKLAAAVTGALCTSREAAGLPVAALGAAVVLCNHLAFRPNLEELGSSLTPDEACDVLAARGMSTAECGFALSALQASHVVSLSSGLLTIAAFERELEAHLRSVTNRMAGWDKRLGLAESKPARPVLELVPSAPAAPAKARAPKRVAKAKPVPGSNYRLTGTDSEALSLADDPTVVRIRAKCDGVAEITSSYINQLKLVFPQLDVEGQVRRAGHWSESNASRRKTLSGMASFLNGWLTRAASDASVRAAVAREARQGNGFGHGGDYEAPAVASDVDHGSAVDEFDDLLPTSDSSVLDASVAPAPASAPAPVVAAAPKVSSVMAARARLGAGASVQRAPVASPRAPQRRLSEMLS